MACSRTRFQVVVPVRDVAIIRAPFIHGLSVLTCVASVASKCSVIPGMRAAPADGEDMLEGGLVGCDGAALAPGECHLHPAVAAVVPVDFA